MMDTLPVVLGAFLGLYMVPFGRLTPLCLKLFNNYRLHVFHINRGRLFDSNWNNTRTPRGKIHTRSREVVGKATIKTEACRLK